MLMTKPNISSFREQIKGEFQSSSGRRVLFSASAHLSFAAPPHTRPPAAHRDISFQLLTLDLLDHPSLVIASIWDVFQILSSQRENEEKEDFDGRVLRSFFPPKYFM